MEVLASFNLDGMKTLNDVPPQFYTKGDIGLRVSGTATRKRLGRAGVRVKPEPPRLALTGRVFDDIVGLGSAALIAHVRQLMHGDTVRVIHQSETVTRVRVCGALDYVIDRTQHQVWVEPAPLTRQERAAKEQAPWYHPLNGKRHDVDLLDPLCKPMWLNYIAARPGWFGYAFARHKGTQKQLFIDQDEMALALQRVIRTTWRHIACDKAFILLRHCLVTALTLQLGPSTVSLAMRSRLRTKNMALDARHMSLVLRHQLAFASMARENPRLLPALTAWLAHDENDSVAISLALHDALPLMRRDLLAAGLPPKAWRYLAQHGFKQLQPHNLAYAPWASMLQTLHALGAARWPALPPRGFLRLLHDTAGHPLHYEDTCDRIAAGWFWQVACDAAHACKGDTAEYSDLFDCIPAWAWMVRHYQLRPDKNQRRKGREWLEFMSEVLQSMALEQDVPEWALWLPPDGWDDSHRHQIVPLQSLQALLREAIELHNCADAFQDRCRAESHILISLRLRATDKPVALACIERRGSNWVLGQLAGPCNQPVRPWVRQLAQEVAAWVRHHHSQRPPVSVPPQGSDNIN